MQYLTECKVILSKMKFNSILIVLIISLTIEAQFVFEHGLMNTKLEWGDTSGKTKGTPGIGRCLISGMTNLSTCIEEAQAQSEGSMYDCETGRRSFMDWWNDFKKIPFVEDDEDTPVERQKKKFSVVKQRPAGGSKHGDSYFAIMTCIKQSASQFIICLCKQAEERKRYRAGEQNAHNAAVAKNVASVYSRPIVKSEASEKSHRRHQNITYINVTTVV